MTTGVQTTQCWVMLDRRAVPANLTARVTSLAVLSLLPHEVGRLLDCTAPDDRLTEEERALATALVAGQPLPAIARQMGVSTRSVHRRIAQLRDRLSAQSTEHLAATLVRMGF